MKKVGLVILILSFWLYSGGGVFAQTSFKFQSDSIVFVDNANSFDELLKKFEGHMVYIDFWGSWCSPCLTELLPHEETDNFLKSNEIIRLYIALEKMENDSALQNKSKERWKENVAKYNLKGFNYYVQLRSEFFKGITEKIMKGKLSLPRFAIIDKQGVIVDNDAPEPAKTEALIKRFNKYLKQK